MAIFPRTVARVFSYGTASDSDKDDVQELIFAKAITEYSFKVTGYFLLVCLLIGLVATSCTKSLAIGMLPVLCAFSFSLYIVLTTVGKPAFFLIANIKHKPVRFVFNAIAVIATLYLSFIVMDFAPLFDVAEVYIDHFYPDAEECKDAIFTVERGGSS